MEKLLNELSDYEIELKRFMLHLSNAKNWNQVEIDYNKLVFETINAQIDLVKFKISLQLKLE